MNVQDCCQNSFITIINKDLHKTITHQTQQNRTKQNRTDQNNTKDIIIDYRIETVYRTGNTQQHRFRYAVWNAASFNVMYSCIFGFQFYNNLKRIRRITPLLIDIQLTIYGVESNRIESNWIELSNWCKIKFPFELVS